MTINQKQVAIKLKALQDKDLALIVKQQVYLPNLGVPKTEKEVSDWLAPKIAVLKAIQSLKSDVEVNAKIASAKAHLDAASLDIIDQKTLGETPVSKDYDAVIEVLLYKFCLAT
jgi:hypothetical protein